MSKHCFDCKYMQWHSYMGVFVCTKNNMCITIPRYACKKWVTK